jgi:hypothetical protein
MKRSTSTMGTVEKELDLDRDEIDEEVVDEVADSEVVMEDVAATTTRATNSTKSRRTKRNTKNNDSPDQDKENTTNTMDMTVAEALGRGRPSMTNNTTAANGTNDTQLQKSTEAGIIKTIYCENFMCHHKLRVDLNRNVTFIHGQNGSGTFVLSYSCRNTASQGCVQGCGRFVFSELTLQ